MNALIDSFGRTIDYLRVSVTDRCDFRCTYCMAEEMTFTPKSQLLSLEETNLIIDAFIELGIKKVRITGGEPLIRRDIDQLLKRVNRNHMLEDYTITTNGNRLDQFAKILKAAGIHRINVSLDTLNAIKFKALTRTGELNQVLKGIDCAIKEGFKNIKLNAVILKGQNDDDILPLTHFALSKGIDISFIEEMPLGNTNAHNRNEALCESAEIRSKITEVYKLTPSQFKTGGPSRYWLAEGYESKIGFISPHSNNFCSDCNRVRITAVGRLLLCLGNENSQDLRTFMREGADDQQLTDKLISALQLKPEKHEFDLAEEGRAYVRNHPDYKLYSNENTLSICFNYKRFNVFNSCI